MKKNRLISCTILVVFFFGLILSTAPNKAIDTNKKIVRILESTPDKLSLEVTVPPFGIKSKIFQSEKFDLIEIPGFLQSCEPSKPQLPLTGYLFGIPLSAQASVEILAAESKLFSPFDIFYTPKMTYYPDSLEIKMGISSPFFESEVDSKIAPVNQFYPPQIVQFDDSTFIREQRIGRLTIFPVQFNPGTKQIRFYSKLKIRINFSAHDNGGLKTQPENQLSEPFERLLSCSLLNYDQAKYWRQARSGFSDKLLKSASIDQNDWYKIMVDEDGIYRLTKANLQNAGLNVSSVDPRKIKVYYQGQEIPIIFIGEEDGVLNDTDYLEFYGFATRNDYTYDNVFWLTVALENGIRMTLQDGILNGTFPVVTRSETRVHFEQNNYYGTSIPNGEGEDHWFWNYLSSPSYLDLTINLNNVVNISSLPCQLKIEYRGISHPTNNPDHHTIAYINGNKVLDNKWDGQSKFQQEGNFVQGYLSTSANTVRISEPGDTGAPIDQIYINWIEIEYWQDYIATNDVFLFQGRREPGTRQFEVTNFSTSNIQLFDITDSTNVKRIANCTVEPFANRYRLRFQDENSGRRYLATTSAKVKSPKSFVRDNSTQLWSRTNQADYIIISHENFYHNLSTLANFRENQGLAVKTIDVQDIYDEFNYGVKDPQAIKDFLTYAFYNWQKPAPTYVLLVGDASYDYKKYRTDSAEDLLPTHLFESSVYNTETSSDNWFGCISGNDALADIFIGRLSVRSHDQLNIIIDKIIDYENHLEGGTWNKKVLFVADNADEGGNFEALSDYFSANYIPSNFNVTKLYLRDYGSATATKDAIISHISSGCLLTNYVGHGSLDLWASEKIFESANVSSLTNSRKIPLVVTMSCINGFFHHALITNSLSEVFLNANNGGAVASFSPSGFGYTAGDQYLGEGLFKAIFQENDYILGSSIQQAKLALFAGGKSFHDHIAFFNLLGDPALQLNISPSTIAVHNQWNLISLPRIPEEPSVNHVLSSLSGKWKKLLAYSNGSWIGADADIPAAFWTLKELEWGRGYWLQTNDQGEINCSGAEKSCALPLYAGWNLIGNSTPLTFPLSNSLSPIQSNWKKILYYANGTWNGADATVPANFWTLKELKPGCGYWLEMTKADTLDFSRIPTSQQIPGLLKEINDGITQSEKAKEKNPTALEQEHLQKFAPASAYTLSIRKPSGFYGSAIIKNLPALAGTKISAWQKELLVAPELTISESGKFGLLLIGSDDSETAEVEGACPDVPIVFKLQTPDGKIYTAEAQGSWQEGVNLRLDLCALSTADNTENPITIEMRVDDKIVGKEIFDGDPISNKATISAFIYGGKEPLTDDNFQVSLNSEKLANNCYSFLPVSDSTNLQGKIIYSPLQLVEGQYQLTFDISESQASAQNYSASFVFIISTKLKLEKIVNFPNPMQRDTKFTYFLLNDEPAQVSIKIYTVAGRLINIIHSASNQIGYNETYWDGTDECGEEVANGVYFYKIIAKAGSEKIEKIERLVVMK